MTHAPDFEGPPYVEQTNTTHENGPQQASAASNFWRDPRPTNKNPNFVRDYFQSSRLHFIGSFRARYEAMMVAVGKRLNVHPSVLLRPSPNSKSNHERVIVHIDMDCFFASIAVTKNPELRGKCIAICHGGGEISSCSYEARAYGVRAGMFCRNARKLCPELLNIDYDFPSYEKVSIQIYSFFHDYPGICVEAVSVDEAYLDITNTIGKDDSQSSAETLVSNLRNRIKMETGCTASAGIGPSKLVARLATRGAKPNGQLRVRQENVIKYLDTLSVRDLPGIGWRTSKRLAARGVTTVPELRAQSLTQLQEEFGERQGQVFHDLARALDSRPVEPLKPRKSIGAEASWGVRFEQKETDKVNKFIEDIADEVATRITSAGAYGKKMTYKVYRKIPDSSMEGWKHLGHGPCTILTKSAKLPSNCVGAGFKTALKERCLEIHNAWNIRHDEVRGVGVQVMDLIFADLNFNQSAQPIKGTRRIDTFFSAADEKDKSLVKKAILAEIKKKDPVRQTDNDEPEPSRPNNEDWLPKNNSKIKPPPSQSALQDHKASPEVVGNEEQKTELQNVRATNAQHPAKNQVSKEQQPGLSNIPRGWDKQVFEALPKALQVELLGGNNLIATQNYAATTLHDEAKKDRVQPREPLRPIKRKEEARNDLQEVQVNFEKRSRRKQAAQVTMTQCADISEFKKRGHEVLNAEEFRERPFKEVVELLDDLKPRRKVAKALTAKEQLQKDASTDGAQESLEPETQAGNRKIEFDIPSPPSLSSDSESSYGVASAVEKQGLEHSRIYANEDIGAYASKLKVWMHSNSGNIMTGHKELLRGRVLEMVHVKELDRACVELRTIRRFSQEPDLRTGGWKDAFNELLADVQDETVKLYGFRLGVRPLGTAQESNKRRYRRRASGCIHVLDACQE